MKKCTRCERVLSEDKFYKQKTTRDGLRYWCIECVIESSTQWKKRNPKKTIEMGQKWDKRNRESRNQYNRKYRNENREVFREHSRAYRETNKEARLAHRLVASAISTGSLSTSPCSKCGSVDFIEGHHNDYESPLDVIWFCRSCHKRLHGALKRRSKYSLVKGD